MRIRNFTSEDIDKIRQFVYLCKPLTLHTPYTYWVLSTYFSDSCFILEHKGKIIGYVSSVKSTAIADTLFLWQIGIEERFREKTYSQQLIGKVVETARKQNCKFLQFTIELDNKVSLQTFISFAAKHDLKMEKIGKAKYYDTLSENHEEETVYQFILTK